MNEGIHLDLDTWIVPGQIRTANLCRGKKIQLMSDNLISLDYPGVEVQVNCLLLVHE